MKDGRNGADLTDAVPVLSSLASVPQGVTVEIAELQNVLAVLPMATKQAAHVQTRLDFRAWVMRAARNELLNMPPPTGLEDFGFGGFYRDVAPTALGRRTGAEKTGLAAVIVRSYRAQSRD
jgi:hypothetical protein